MATDPSDCNYQNKLLDLLLELQIIILSLLEWDDVLRARQTCRHLRDVSLARPVWLALFKWYSAVVSPHPFCLEKPLDLYTNLELEHLILRWQKTKVCWRLSQCQGIPIHEHFISPDDVPNCLHLVEGGRWLLVGTNSGSVVCYDLDASMIVPVVLVPSPFDDDEETEILLSVDMDPDSDYLKFNLGVITSRVPDAGFESIQPPLPFFRWIQIWQVTTVVDRNDRKAKRLQAKQLASFPEEHRSNCDSFRLRGRNIAYGLHIDYELCDFRNIQCVIIVNWTSCNSASLVYTRKVIWQIFAIWLALLPGDMILCYIIQSFLLFNLNDVPATTLDPSNFYQRLTKTFPQAVAHLSLFASVLSQPYFLPNSTRISVLTHNAVIGIIIPHSNSAPQAGAIEQIELLSRHGLVRTYYSSIGYNHALNCCWPELVTLQYTWPGDCPSDLVSKNIIELEAYETPGCVVRFDESSGRIILSVHEIEKTTTTRHELFVM